LLLTSLGCTGAPEPAPATETPGEQSSEQQEQQIAALQAEVGRLREELRTAHERLELSELSELSELAEQKEQGENAGSELPDEESVRQLQRENERLRELVEELRLALIAAEGVESPDAAEPSAKPDSAPPASEPPTEPLLGPEAPDAEEGLAQAQPSAAPDPPEEATRPLPGGFETVRDVNAPPATDTPTQLASQGIERVLREGGGYRYVDASAGGASGAGVYLELTLLPERELPEATLEAKTVYPAESEPLFVERAVFEIAGQSFDLEPREVTRTRDGRQRAETASFSLTPQVRRLLTLTQRRPEADLTVTFSGPGGERSRRVTRRERLALANMIYTLREMGGVL
jgi:hypothetical protein